MVAYIISIGEMACKVSLPTRALELLINKLMRLVSSASTILRMRALKSLLALDTHSVYG